MFLFPHPPYPDTFKHILYIHKYVFTFYKCTYIASILHVLFHGLEGGKPNNGKLINIIIEFNYIWFYIHFTHS